MDKLMSRLEKLSMSIGQLNPSAESRPSRPQGIGIVVGGVRTPEDHGEGDKDGPDEADR
jgi:hypothetical protein